MKTTTRTIAAISITFFFMFTYLTLTTSEPLLERCWTDAACNAEVAIDHATLHLKAFAPKVNCEKPDVDIQQKKLEETIPHFHQQLSAFVSF